MRMDHGKSGFEKVSKMSVKTIQVSAPAKVILFGEHSVVYGAPAIAASIDRRTTIEIAPSRDQKLQLKFIGLSVDASFPLPVSATKAPSEMTVQQRQAVECALLILNNLPEPLRGGVSVTVSSDFPTGAGLGSSASFSVSLSAAFLAHQRLVADTLETDGDGRVVVTEELQTKILQAADKCERVFHGNPSGIDTTTCMLGGIVRFQRGTKIEKIADKLAMKIAVVDTKVARQTSAVVEKTKSLRDRLPAPTLQVYDAMRLVAEAAIEEIRCPSETSEKLLDLVRMNHGLLYALGVSHPALEKIALSVADLGVGFKLTGAGAGGNALVFIPPEVQTEDVCRNLKGNGYEPNIVTVGVEGLQIKLL